MALDDYEIGLRTLDIEHGFREFRPEGLIQVELSNTLLLGKALNLALHMRGLNVVTDTKGLTHAAAELGIGSTELRSVLLELAEIDWVRLKTSGSKITRVEVSVPELRDGFEVVGERWRSLGPTEIEQASVLSLSEAIVRPYSTSRLDGDFGLDKEVARAVVEIGESGTYLKRHRLDDGSQLIFSPLFGDNNPEKAFEVANKYGDHSVQALIGQVRSEQGAPTERITESQLLQEAVLAGLVLAPGVKDKRFVFTPQAGISPQETVVLDKARAIVSCVRYGQNFAEITKIFSPARIVEKLIEKKQLAPHSEHLEQYGLLVIKGIGRVDPVGSKWQFRVLDTPDNMRALRVAADLLGAGAAVHQSIDEKTQLRVLNPSGSYSTPITQRVRLSRHAKTQSGDARSIEAISELIRGARRA